MLFHPTEIKNKLHLSTVQPILTNCSLVWRAYLITESDINSLERVQRRATKYILNDFNSDY